MNSVSSVNALSEVDFVKLLEGIYENSPWVAMAASSMRPSSVMPSGIRVAVAEGAAFAVPGLNCADNSSGWRNKKQSIYFNGMALVGEGKRVPVSEQLQR